MATADNKQIGTVYLKSKYPKVTPSTFGEF